MGAEPHGLHRTCHQWPLLSFLPAPTPHLGPLPNQPLAPIFLGGAVCRGAPSDTRQRLCVSPSHPTVTCALCNSGNHMGPQLSLESSPSQITRHSALSGSNLGSESAKRWPLPRKTAIRNTFLAGELLIQRLETQARGQCASFSCLEVFARTAHGLWPARGGACSAAAARGQRTGSWRQRFSRIDFLPAGKRVIKAGMLRSALDPHVGGDTHARRQSLRGQPCLP